MERKLYLLIGIAFLCIGLTSCGVFLSKNKADLLKDLPGQYSEPPMYAAVKF